MNLPTSGLQLIFLHLRYLRVREHIGFFSPLVLFGFKIVKSAGSKSRQSWYFLKGHSSQVHAFNRLPSWGFCPSTSLACLWVCVSLSQVAQEATHTVFSRGINLHLSWFLLSSKDVSAHFSPSSVLHCM